jgi:Tol biopolymer transport system component
MFGIKRLLILGVGVFGLGGIVMLAVLLSRRDPSPFYLLAFVSNRGGQNDIYIMFPPDGPTWQLTDDGAYERYMDWHPAGGQLVYMVNPIPYNRSTQVRFIRLPDGKITRYDSRLESYSNPVWSTDGQNILFVAHSGRTIYSLYSAHPMENTILLLDSDQTIFHIAKTPWPDQWLVVMNSQIFPERLAIWQFDLNGYVLKPLVQSGDTNSQPHFSPDGRQLVYAQFREGKSEIMLYDFETETRTNITAHDAYALFPAWSPDGQWIAYSTTIDGNAEIYLMRPDGTQKTNLTHHPADETYLAWSPWFEFSWHPFWLRGVFYLGIASSIFLIIHETS